MEWYCVHTKPCKETAVDEYVRRILGCETYYPRLRRARCMGGVKRWTHEPLFPRYLFSRFDLAEYFRGVRYAPEVCDVVTFGDRPVVVDDAIIEQLKLWAGDAVDLLSIQPELHPGDRVEIMDGPLRGLQAVVKCGRNGRDRVCVLLATLAYQPQVVLERSCLARVA